MTNIGDQLLQPEEGWQRIDDTHPYILYSSNWKETSLSGFYNGKTHYLESLSTDVIKNEFVRIKFFGTKILLPMQTYIDYSSSVEIDLDGEKQVINLNDATNPRNMVLLYRKDNLENKEHVINIKSLDGLRFGFDCVDIDNNGYLIAQIGCQLLQPESGWKRIDDSNSLIAYTGDNWKYTKDYNLFYNNTMHYIDDGSYGKINFKFSGTKLRIIGQAGTNIHSPDCKITIDDTQYTYSAQLINEVKRQILLYEITGLKNTAHTVELNQGTSSLSISLDAIDIDESGKLLTDKEYEQLISKHLIKYNDKYYTIENDTLVEIVDVITIDLVKNRGISTETLTSNQSLLPDKFKLISIKDNTFNINSIKSDKELVVASNNFSSKIADHIDYFKTVYEKNTNSSIKLAFSIDNGLTWKGNNFEDLSVEIPLKPYSELSEEEKIKWNNAKESIYTNGIPIEDLESFDFNTLDFEYIRFAYVLSVTSADDICNTTKLQWQFDAKGSMQLMDSSEIGIEVLSDSIKITPKTEEELIKVNITNGTCSGLENPSQDESLTNEEIKTFVSGILS